jgi:hypothetical protein
MLRSASLACPSGKTSSRRNKSFIVSRLIAPACHAATMEVISWAESPFVL